MSDTTNPAKLVWAILSVAGYKDRTPDEVVETVHTRRRIPEVEIRDCLNALVAHGHLIIDDRGMVRRVPDSGIKSTAMAYGLDEEDVAMVFHMWSGAVAAGDTEMIDAVLRQVAARKAAATPKRTRRRPDA